MKSIAGTEIILTIGIIIAVGVSLVQLRGVFYGQQLLAQEEVVVAFARDLESIADRAIATTGDAAFVYYPTIKKYTLNISSLVKERTVEEKKVNLYALKKRLVEEIHRELYSLSASVRNDICTNQEVYGNSSFSATLSQTLSNTDINSAVKSAMLRIAESYLINSYSIISDVVKKNETLITDYCDVASTEVSYYDYSIRFTTSYGDFVVSSMDVYSASFKTRYTSGQLTTLRHGENITFSQLQFGIGPIIKSYKQQDVKIVGPATLYSQSSITVKNLDNNIKSCRAGIYCGGGDCGAITFGHYVYSFEPGKEVTLVFYPGVKSGDLIIFCDDGSYYRRTINFTKTEPEEPDLKIIETSIKTIVGATSSVAIYDKISGKETIFSKSYEIIENYFEDCDKIFVIKKEEKIVIYCRCLEINETCKNSLLCCSGYCNETSKKCEEMPICPAERICPGAPESKKDVLGKDCCPADIPVCASGHCCPRDKPKWCKKPVAGEPRCMSEDKIKTDCKSIRICDGPLPNSFDWRNVDGKNWLPPVRNQGSCGSCWAFSAVGATEGTYNVEHDAPGANTDLSEQDLVSCSGAGSCRGARGTAGAIGYIQSHGIVDEACFPYQAADVPCLRCSDWNNRLWRIKSYNFVSNNFDEIKRALVCYGPLSVGSNNWEHAITLVGYDDSRGTWTIRNSWGASWGNGGYANIPYSGHPYSDISNYVIYVNGVTSP